jgi:HlyD family secretion protein
MLKQINWKLIPFSKSIPLAILGIVMMFYYVNNQVIGEPEREPTRTPAASPYQNAITGAGIVEPIDESVNVAPYASGKVIQIFVKEGQRVPKGHPLFQLDTDLLNAQIKKVQADLSAAQARLKAAQARLHRLDMEPRGVSLPPLKARMKTATAMLRQQKDKLARLENVADGRAISQQELVQQRLLVEEAEAKLLEAQSTLAEKEAGAWQPELDEAQAQVQEQRALIESLKAQLKELNVQLAQSTVKAPKAGTVLQVNARVGETLQLMQMSGKSSTPAVLLGDVKELQVRVDIDEVLASQVKAGMHAKAFIKGNSKLGFPLTFERIEPFMVPKTSLTGGTAERNDVRVLQVIYRFTPPADFSVYPGQQVDVYLDASFNQVSDADAQATTEEIKVETPS